MGKSFNGQNNTRSIVITLVVVVIITALLLETIILMYVDKNTSCAKADAIINQVAAVLENNERSENALMASLKEDYIVRAQAAAYIIDAKPALEYSAEELKDVAQLIEVDEIHIFDAEGTLYSGTHPNYYGMNMDDGEQIGYFKQMLSDKNLSLCQNTTPNTAENRSMMYAATWNEAGTHIVEVGIEPVRLLDELRSNAVADVVSDMPVTDGTRIYVAGRESGEIYGASERSDIGKFLSDMGFTNLNFVDGWASKSVLVGGFAWYARFGQTNDYTICVTTSTAANVSTYFMIMLMELVYLLVAAAVVIAVMKQLYKTSQERDEQYAVLNSMAEIYYTMHLIDLKQNTVVEYSSKNRVGDLGQIYAGQADLMLGSTIEHVIAPEYVDSIKKFTDLTTVAQRMGDKVVISGEFVGKDLGWFRAFFIVTERGKNGLASKVIFATRGIEEEKRKERVLESRSNTDQLTGCLNRRARDEDLERMTVNIPFVYISLDVNGLKSINDSKGHAAGDELIKGTAECLKACMGHIGKIYRTGGDEFAVILDDDGRQLAALKTDFDDRMRNWTGKLVSGLSASYGAVSSIEKEWISMDEILDAADRRMYKHKSDFYREHGLDQLGSRDAQSALGVLSLKTIYVNLIDDTYRLINLMPNEYVYGDSLADGFSKRIAELARGGRVHPADRDKFLHDMNIDELKAFFMNGHTHKIIRYRRLNGDDYIPVDMHLVAAPDSDGNHAECYVYVLKCEN